MIQFDFADNFLPTKTDFDQERRWVGEINGAVFVKVDQYD